jgi:cohesin complex subunit SA-1/2
MHASGILYDDIALIENIHLWVTTMSSSFLRPFRHTATVVALAATTGLCSIAKAQAETNANSLRQLEGEQKKKGKAANQGRVNAFQQKVDQGNERREVCENTIKDFFDTVFVHRYRDVDPKIRTDCVEALGQWIQILPSIFFDGQYLRYLGWMLSDTSAPTRHEVIKQLEKIMKNKDNVGGIQHFIERFRPRIVEIAAQDSEVSVRASAVELLDRTREAGMLEPDDIDVIGKLIFDTEARVRKAVVGFFAENIKDLYESKIEELGGEETLEDAFTLDDEDHESPRPGWIKLKCLAEVILSYDAEGEELSSDSDEVENDILHTLSSDSRFSLAAQALYDKIPEIKDWETLAGYLLFDHSTKVDPKSPTADVERSLRDSFKLDDKEEVILLEILDAAVKLSLTQSEDHDRSKKKRTARTESVELQESTARRLATIIPGLLKKFGAKPKTAAAVLRLEQGLNLGVFQALRQGETAYADLLHEIGVQFKGHADQRVLSEASAALLHAKGFEELEDVTEENVKSLWDDTVDDMRRRFLAHKGPTARGNLSVLQLTELSNSVARVSKLASITNPVHRFENNTGKPAKRADRANMVPIDMLIEIVGRGLLVEADPDIDEVEDQLVASACQAVLFYFMWKARSLQQAVLESEPIPNLEVDYIRQREEEFATALTAVLSSRAGLDDLRLLATGTLLDLYVLFSTIITATKSLATEAQGDEYEHLHTLTKDIEPEVQEELTSIFVAAEKQFAKKAKKSLEAPADDDEPEDVDSEPEDEEEDDAFTEADRKSEALKAEQKLCELTAKLVLAILAGVIDASGHLKSKFRARILRNRSKLGPNFKEVVAFLDTSKTKGVKKSHKSKAQQDAAEIKSAAKSTELVDDEDDDPFAENEPEEGTAEDLRRKELLDEDGPESLDGDANSELQEPGGDGDDIMGD